MGSWAFYAEGFEYWSSELFRIHGLDPRGKPPSVEEYLALVYPEDRAFMQQGITQRLAEHPAQLPESNGSFLETTENSGFALPLNWRDCKLETGDQEDVKKLIFNLRAIYRRKNFAPGCPISDYSGPGIHFISKTKP